MGGRTRGPYLRKAGVRVVKASDGARGRRREGYCRHRRIAAGTPGIHENGIKADVRDETQTRILAGPQLQSQGGLQPDNKAGTLS